MIKINLAKHLVAKKRSKKTRKTFQIPNWMKIVSLIVLIALIVSTVVFLLKFTPVLKTLKSSKQTKEAKETIQEELINSQAVEDIVKDFDTDVDLAPQDGILQISYEKLTFLEKVNYEFHFAKNVFDLLSKRVISGIDFISLHVDSFRSVQGSGVSDSKEKVINLFKAFRKDNIKLLPKPYSSISKDEEGYYFSISCVTDFGLDLQAPFIKGAEELPIYEELDHIIKNIVDIALENKMKINTGPTRLRMNQVEQFKRYIYRVSATSSYTNFISFLHVLYKKEIPCAFEKIDVKALDLNFIRINAVLIITTVDY